MKKIFIYLAIIKILTLVSCGSDASSRLEKLKKQQAEIEGEITSLESQAGERKDSLDPSKFRLVGVTEVRPAVFDHYISVQGELDGDQNVTVYAEAMGTVKEIFANAGQRVKKGQVLAQIDDEQYRKQLENLKTQYNFAADMYEKQKRLWDQNIGSEVQYLQSRTTKESFEQQISTLEEQIGKFKIKSPVDGTIEESNVKPGSIVSPDPRMAAFRVVEFRNLKVSAEISEAYAAMVKPGSKVLISFPDLEQEIASTVNFVSRYIDPVNRTFIMESKVTEGLPGMKANMIAIVRINDYHSENSIQLPMNVIMTDLNGSYVFVIRKKDNYFGAFRQPVKIGNSYNGMAEIVEGLQASDKVITTGFRELIDGEYVRVGESTETLSSK